ncbi:peptidoglycan-binding protein [Allorhizobium borbori]|uniref:Localization factor PodJL n=1 Tax=Allorhizobium borbori TaxID=485907 RepID=A0A7W6NZ97_9HYPH|nr:peptidoglycan-binding protein [Allorhizobium borbori]MBB4101512.1 localization factor PodJL [Allorhizobium borbori]
MNGSRSSHPRQGDRSSLDALSRTIEGLEARIEDLMGAPGGGRDPRRAPERERPRDREIEHDRRPPPPARAAGSSVQSALDEIRQRQRALETNRQPARAADPYAPRASEAYAPQPRAAERYEERPRPRDHRSEAPARDTTQQDIAKALVNLRHELKQDISEGVSREIGGLLSEMRAIKSMAGDRRYAEDMRGDLARLADGIGQISRQARPDEAQSLRAEFEDLRAMMDNLAREDSVQRMESRWNGFEERMGGFNTETLQDELVSLAYRLDDIKSQLGSMNDVPAIRALEDRMMSIASTLDEIGKRIEPRDTAVAAEQFAGLDRRLDEISRAIAATSRAATPAVDPVFLQRLENRIGALAEQIEDIGAAASRRPDPAVALNARLESLAERIEDLAGERAAARLEERIDALSALMESNQRPAQQQPDLTRYLSDISQKIDAMDHGLVNDVLAERLDLLARRIDEMDVSRHPAPAYDDSAIRRLENQIGGIAARLDETVNAPVSDNRALANLEAQIANLSHLISQPRTASGPLTLSPELDSRMTAIEDYIATSDEYIIEAARQAAEAVLDGFMRSGGVSAAAMPAADIGALSGLADDLRHLEELTRNSEERTHRTFEALHDTLLQIAGRLEHIESTRPQAPVEDGYAEPAPRRQADAARTEEPAYAFTGEPRREDSRPIGASTVPVFNDEGDDFFAPGPTNASAGREDHYGPIISEVKSSEGAAAPAAGIRPPEMPKPVAKAAAEKTSLIGSLTKRFLNKSKESAAAFEASRTVVDPAPPIAPDDQAIASAADEFLEPGTGVPDVKRILERVRASQGQNAAAAEDGPVDYISAARRAAQAAARELGPEKGAGKKGKATRAPASTAGESALSRYRRPLLLTIGAILLVVMSMPLVNTLLNGNSVPPVGDNTNRPAIEETVPEKKAETSMAPAVEAPQEQAAVEAETAAPSQITPAPAGDVETVPLSPAGTAATATSTFEAQPGTTTPAISVPADVQPASLADAARQGDALALFEIGARYSEGRGVTANPPEAAVWYKLSADRGFAPAQYRLANLYEKGTGVAPDAAKAIEYYRKAASQGNASAMHNLAVMYASGATGTPDLTEAVNWFRQAADLGVSDSQFNLAILYARGSGVNRDLEESYKWFAIAANGGDKDAAQKRDEVANALKPEQLESARAKAEVWKQLPLDSKANDAIIPDEWAGKGLKTASIDMKKAIRNIQAILNNNGYDAGAPDGELGPKTVTAIKSFQKSVGQEPTGKITDALVKELLARNK